MNQIRTGAIISYVALFLNIVIGLLYIPWMINTIGKADYGLYTLAMSVISLFVFDFGLGSAITRFVSKFLAEGRQDKVDCLLGMVFKLYLLVDLVILLGLAVIYFFLPSIYHGLTPEEMANFRIVYIIASMFSVIREVHPAQILRSDPQADYSRIDDRLFAFGRRPVLARYRKLRCGYYYYRFEIMRAGQGANRRYPVALLG